MDGIAYGIPYTDYIHCNTHNTHYTIHTIQNPLLKTTDIRKVAAFAKKKGLLLVVDGTFMSPYLQHPLELGADLVLHSVTKFIAGHSDVLMGCVMTNSDELSTKLRNIQNLCGAVPSPFECWLTLRGLKTLAVRMEASQKNAMQIATYLEQHPVVEKVRERERRVCLLCHLSSINPATCRHPH